MRIYVIVHVKGLLHPHPNDKHGPGHPILRNHRKPTPTPSISHQLQPTAPTYRSLFASSGLQNVPRLVPFLDCA